MTRDYESLGGWSVRRERGSATIWMVAIGALLAVATMVATGIAAVVSAQHRADTAADMAALSAVNAVPAGPPDCAVAERIASAHHASLTGCSTSGTEVTVTVEVASSAWPGAPVTVHSRARAGPSTAVPVRGQPTPVP